jgi:DNA-binding NarL/FixJ family response regulator
MNVTIYLVLTGVALIFLSALVWVHIQQRSVLERLEDRLAHLNAGVSLLTDATETGLRHVGTEIGRLPATRKTPAPRPRATTKRRVARAVKQGRSVRDIAADEGISEGEVHLHLQMDKSRKDRAHAAVR